jgi:hypothetical protein
MANQAPGVTINVTANATTPANPTSTSNWFVAGMAAGPAGIAVPIKSMNDFNTYFGQIVSGGVTGRYILNANVSSTLLYDSLDVFFREGGSAAWVSRVASVSSGVVATSTTTGGLFLLTAAGSGTWANSSNAGANGLILTITGSTVNATTVYATSLAYNGNVLATATSLGTNTDIVNWVNSLPPYISMCVASTQSGTTVLPASGSSVSVYMTGGTDVAVADADTPAAIAVFTDILGPGQISYPGNTSTTTAGYLVNHALAFNRVALLDAQNTATAATIVTQANTVQSAATDPSYAAMFAPWLIVPGIVNSNPAVPTSTVFNRTVPPVALAAALMAKNDASNDCNVSAAGTTNGASTYATGVSQTYITSDRALLNASGVSVIKLVPNINVIALYGYRSLSFAPSFVPLNNVRFRMQIIRDLDVIGESFVFQEIDGKGQLFAAFNGAIAGQMNAYWGRGSLYGLTADEAFFVNTGTSVNTPTTITAGQIIANVGAKFSPQAEFVIINVTKYLVSSNLPA